MPVTVRGGDILFNDGSTQSTAAGAVTTTAVLNATAGAALGAVGTYGWLVDNTNTIRTEGAVAAGSSLRWASDSPSGGGYSIGGTPAGTWRAHGRGVSNVGYGQGIFATLWLRIS